jgi:RNA polymerase sigma factor (sigma-70 family)
VSFDEIFSEVYPELHRYCVRMAGDPDLGEDLAQEAFVRLLDRRVSGDPPRLRSWLFTVATHLMRERARVRTNRKRLLEEHPVRPGELPQPDQELDRKEGIGRVRRALAELDTRDRTLLLLRQEGFSYRELAEAVGVKATSVGTLLARARRRFVRAMNEEGE